MRKTLLVSCAVLVTLTFAACKKSSSNKSRTELITQSGWVTTNVEVGAGGTWTADPDWTNLPACERDDVLVLRTNMTYEFNEGGSKCDPSDPQVFDTGTWSWQDGESKVVIDGITYTIESLTESSMTASTSVNFGAGNFTYRISYRH